MTSFPASRGVPAGEEDPRAVLDDLMAQWPSFWSADTFSQPAARRGKKINGSDLARISAVMGLVSHAYDAAHAIVLLLDSNQANSATPIVRSVYESALTAVWLVQSKDQAGITAFVHEYARGRRALQQDAREAVSASFREGAASMPNADPSPYAGQIDNTRQFREMCLDLKPGGVDAYVLYRILSGYSHASMNIVDLYSAENGKPIPEKRQVANEALAPATLV